ncbi:MAG: DUF362 domain-containing protein [Promethearchaeota archaeon]
MVGEAKTIVLGSETSYNLIELLKEYLLESKIIDKLIQKRIEELNSRTSSQLSRGDNNGTNDDNRIPETVENTSVTKEDVSEGNKDNKNKLKIFIRIDLNFPEPFPVTTDPRLLKMLTDYLLLKDEISEIIIGTNSLYNIPSKYSWYSLGYSSLIEDNNRVETNRSRNNGKSSHSIRFIELNKENTSLITGESSFGAIQYPEVVKSADIFINIVNPKFNDIYGIDGGISSLETLLPYKNRKKLMEFKDQISGGANGGQGRLDPSSDKYLQRKLGVIYEIYNFRQPDLTIMDLRALKDNIGDLIYGDTKLLGLNYLLLGEGPNNAYVIDRLLTELLNIKSEDNYLINYIKERNKDLISLEDVENMVFINKNVNNKREIRVGDEKVGKKDDKEKGKHKSSKKAFSKYEKKGSELDTTCLSFEEFKNIINRESNYLIGSEQYNKKLTEYLPKNFELLEGAYCYGCRHTLIILLNILNNFLIKDKENIKKNYILLGDKPPEPDHDGSKNIKDINIILFGDCAVNSTEDYGFRLKKKEKKVMSEEELELKMVSYEALQRDKLLEWEAKLESIRNNIEKQFKEDEAKKSKALKSLETKDKKKREKMKKSIEKYQQKLHKKREKQIKASQIIRYKLNKMVIEIPGCPPNIFEILPVLIRFFGKNWVGNLHRWDDQINLYYDRGEYSKFYKEYSKKRMKLFQEKIKEREKLNT